MSISLYIGIGVVVAVIGASAAIGLVLRDPILRDDGNLGMAMVITFILIGGAASVMFWPLAFLFLAVWAVLAFARSPKAQR